MRLVAFDEHFVLRDIESSDHLSSLLFELSEQLGSADAESVWNEIGALPRDGIILPGDFRGRFNLSHNLIDDVVLRAVKAGLLEPVYRLNAPQDVLEEIEHTEWTANLTELRRVFELDGQRYDGTDPTMISIAFRRLFLGPEKVPT